MTDPTGQSAFITGGASGLGLATARALGEAGASVVLADIDHVAAKAAANELQADGIRAMEVAIDVTNEESWTAAAEKCADFGPVNILFSNAGVGGGAGAFEEYDIDVWRWNYAVNAHAHLYACRTFMKAMKAAERPAHLVLTSSMVAIVPPPISVGYISSKFATLGIAMALRNELAETNVGLSVLMPGMSATRIVETTRSLRPGEREEGAAATTSQSMQGVLSAGMDPAKIGERVVQAIKNGEFWIFTHPEWKEMAELITQDMLGSFGQSADPSYRGDDIARLIAANGGRMFGAKI